MKSEGKKKKEIKREKTILLTPEVMFWKNRIII